MSGHDQVLRGLQQAQADGYRVMLTFVPQSEDLAHRAYVDRGTAPAPGTHCERVRVLARLAEEVR